MNKARGSSHYRGEALVPGSGFGIRFPTARRSPSVTFNDSSENERVVPAVIVDTSSEPTGNVLQDEADDGQCVPEVKRLKERMEISGLLHHDDWIGKKKKKKKRSDFRQASATACNPHDVVALVRRKQHLMYDDKYSPEQLLNQQSQQTDIMSPPLSAGSALASVLSSNSLITLFSNNGQSGVDHSINESMGHSNFSLSSMSPSMASFHIMQSQSPMAIQGSYRKELSGPSMYPSHQLLSTPAFSTTAQDRYCASHFLTSDPQCCKQTFCVGRESLDYSFQREDDINLDCAFFSDQGIINTPKSVEYVREDKLKMGFQGKNAEQYSRADFSAVGCVSPVLGCEIFTDRNKHRFKALSSYSLDRDWNLDDPLSGIEEDGPRFRPRYSAYNIVHKENNTIRGIQTKRISCSDDRDVDVNEIDGDTYSSQDTQGHTSSDHGIFQNSSSGNQRSTCSSPGIFASQDFQHIYDYCVPSDTKDGYGKGGLDAITNQTMFCNFAKDPLERSSTPEKKFEANDESSENSFFQYTDYINEHVEFSNIIKDICEKNHDEIKPPRGEKDDKGQQTLSDDSNITPRVSVKCMEDSVSTSEGKLVHVSTVAGELTINPEQWRLAHKFTGFLGRR
ncbi:hypothetical protein SK128_002795, partial [Halocaridina rubra]